MVEGTLVVPIKEMRSANLAGCFAQRANDNLLMNVWQVRALWFPLRHGTVAISLLIDEIARSRYQILNWARWIEILGRRNLNPYDIDCVCFSL